LPELLNDLIILNPYDANRLFWFGYVEGILFNRIQKGIPYLLKAIAIQPELSYAHLVLAGYTDIPGEKLRLLEAVVQQHPTLLRALIEMAEILMILRQNDQAKSILEFILKTSPYIETEYGIMNNYINDVLTGATRWKSIRDEALSKNKSLT
jgi:tetratricopeptide (TPR) repeat protein